MENLNEKEIDQEENEKEKNDNNNNNNEIKTEEKEKEKKDDDNNNNEIKTEEEAKKEEKNNNEIQKEEEEKAEKENKNKIIENKRPKIKERLPFKMNYEEEKNNEAEEEENHIRQNLQVIKEMNKRKAEARLREIEKNYNDLFTNIVDHWENDKENFLSFYNQQVYSSLTHMFLQPCIASNLQIVTFVFKFLFKYFNFLKDKLKEIPFELINIVYYIFSANIFSLNPKINNNTNYNRFDDNNELISDKIFYYLFKEFLPNEEIENCKLGYCYNCMMKYFLESLLKIGFYENFIKDFLSRDDFEQHNFPPIIYFGFIILSNCEESFVKKHSDYNGILMNQFTKKMKMYLDKAPTQLKNNKDKFYAFVEHIRRLYLFMAFPALSFVLDDYIKDNKEDQIKEFLFSIYNFFEFLLKQQKLEYRIFAIDKLTIIAQDYKYYNNALKFNYNEPEKIFEYTKKIFISFLVKINIFDLVCGENIHEALIERFYFILSLLYKNNSFTPEEISSLWKLCQSKYQSISNSIISLFGKLLPEFSIEDCNSILNTILSMNFNEVNEVTLKLLENFFLSEHRHQSLLNILFKYSNELSFYKGLSSNIIESSRNILIKLLFNKKYSIDLIQCINNCLFGLDNNYLLNTNKDIFLKIMNEFSKDESMHKNAEIFKIINENIDNFGIFVSYLDEQYSIFWILLRHIFYAKKLLIFFSEVAINLKKKSKEDNFDLSSSLDEDKLLLKYKEYEKASNKENSINNENQNESGNEINKSGDDNDNNKKTKINCLLPTSRKDIDDYLKFIIKDFIFFVKDNILKKDIDLSDSEIINEFFSKYEFSFEKKTYKKILTQIIDSILSFHEKGNIHIKRDIFDFLYKLLVENCVHNDEKEIFFNFIKNTLVYQFNNVYFSLTDENIEYLCLEKIASSEITSLPYSAYEAFILYLIYINEKNGNINYSHSTNKFIDIKKINLLIGFKTLLEFNLFCNNVNIAMNSLGILTNIIEVASCDMLNRNYILNELFSRLEKNKIKTKENTNNAKSKIALRRLLRLISVVNRTKVKKNLYDKNDPNNILELNINNNFFNNNEENIFTSFKAFKGLTVKEFKEQLSDQLLCANSNNLYLFNNLNFFPQVLTTSYSDMKNLIINFNLITLYYNEQILKNEFTLADYDIKSGENILLLSCMPNQNEQEFSMTDEQLKEGYEQFKVVFNDRFNEEIMKEALYKHKGDIQNAILYMTEESNAMELLKEIESKKNVPKSKEELICLEEDKFNLLLDILNEDDNDINDSVWDLFSEIKFQEEFIINNIEKDFDKINEEKNLNKKLLLLKIINSVIFDDKNFCKNNKVTKNVKNKWISKFISNEKFIIEILTFLSNIKMEKSSEINYSKILEILINLFKSIITKIINLNKNTWENSINTNSKENENPNENHENLNINEIINEKSKKEEEEKDGYGEYTIEGKEADNFMNILSKNNFVSFIYNILVVVLQLSKVQTKMTKKKIIKNIYDFLIEFLQMFPNDVKQFLEEENKSKKILNILTSEKEVEIRKTTLDFVKKLIDTLKSKQKDEENKIDIRSALLNYYYPQLISDEVYCEEFYALYHYLFNIESLMPNDIQIDKIIETFFDYLYEFYINNHNKNKEEEKYEQIKNKLNYNLYILSSFTPLYNELLKNELEKKMNEKKDIISLLYNCLFKIENEDNSNINYLFSDEQLRNNSFTLLENLISLDKKYYQIILQKIILHHRQISVKKSDLPLSYSLRDVKSQKFLGLKNLGATCYLNSLFQQMFMIPTFQQDIFNFNIIDNPEYKDKNDLKYSTIYNMQISFASLKNSIMSFYTPISFINSFKTAFNGEPIHLGVQQDTDEFLAILCEELEKEGKKFGKENFLENSFKGKITNEIVSLEKEYPYYSQSDEPFNRITLDIKGHKKLEDALDAYVKGEILEGENQYYVEKYKKKISIKKRTSLKKIGNQIIIHLKRFEFDFVMFQNNKLNDYLKFPLKLNLKRWTRVYLRKNEVNDIDDNIISEEEKENLDDEKMNYELTGILIHSGSSLQSGHYYSFIKDQETDLWYKFNDSVISDYNIDKDLEKECFGNINNKINQYGKGAYLLFYTKKECIDKNKDYNQKIKINEKILKEVQKENAYFLNLKTFASEVYHKFFIKFINYSLNYLQNKKSDIEENDTNNPKSDNKYSLLVTDELRRDVEIYKKVLLKINENKENNSEINENKNEIKVLPDNIDEIYEKCVSEYNEENNQKLSEENIENIDLDKIVNLFCYYFFGIVIQYNDKETILKECVSLLKEILQLSDSYSINVMKIMEKNLDIFVDLLFKYGFIDKDMTGINQYIFDMYKILFHTIYIFEKNKYGFITPETYAHFIKDEKGTLVQVESNKSLFLRMFKKIFCDNLEKCRKEYSRESLFLNLFSIITVACPESCLVSCNILLQLPSFITNNNLPQYKSIINPNLKMGNPPNLLYSSIFYEIIIRCATPWMLKNREDSPYMMLNYPQGIKNLDLSLYPKLPNDWEKILTKEFLLEHILSNNAINSKNILWHICYEDENVSVKVMKLVNNYLKQPYYIFFDKEDIFLNTFEIFELDDSLTDKRLNALFELEEKEDQKADSLVEFYLKIKNQWPILALQALFLFSKAIEKHYKVFEYFKKNKSKFDWVNAFYINFFDDKGNLPPNVINLQNKHPDLLQSIEYQFIIRLEI